MAVADPELERLLAPLDGAARCGASLLHDPVFDAIQEARREDDPSLPQGVWAAPLKKADWPAVARLCAQALAARSKDVQLATWLGEAWIALHGAACGLRATLLLQELCERYWEDLHPLPRDGDIEFRTMPLEWADVNWAAALHGRVALAGGPGGGHTLRHWQEALVADNEARKLDNAPLQADAASALIIESAAAPQATALQRHLDRNAPRFGQLRRTLQAAADMVRQCLRAHPGAQASAVPLR
ncbi:MAG: type VI secretion system protein TssA [Noviherbaspirillum sp.]